MAGERLRGLDAGTSQRQTARLTTERLLKVFRGIALDDVCLPEQKISHVTPLSDLRKRVLTLLWSVNLQLAVSDAGFPGKTR